MALFFEKIKQIGPRLIPFFEMIFIYFFQYVLRPESSAYFMVIKALPIFFLMIFVMSNGFNLKFEYSYSRRIFLGLAVSMIGDSFLVCPGEYFIFGLFGLGAAHLIYLSAFGFKPANFKLALILLIVFIPLTVFYIVFIEQNDVIAYTIIYMGISLLIFWRAVSRLQIFNKEIEWTWAWKLCCAVGAFYMLIADFVLTFDFFVYPLPYGHPIMMFAYYISQLGIALSVVESDIDYEVNDLVLQPIDLWNRILDVYNYFKTLYYRTIYKDKLVLPFQQPNTSTSEQQTP